MLCFLLYSLSSYAQIGRTVYKTKLLDDTLVATSNKDFLYNNITITNLTTDKITVLVNIEVPQGWGLITQNLQTFSLTANEVTNIPIRISPKNSKTAGWQKVKIEYRLNNAIETTTDTFRVRVQEFTKFKAYLPNSNMVFTAYQKSIMFPLFIANSGNIPKDYTLSFKNPLLQLNYDMQLHLEPGEDTIYNIPLRISEAQWSLLRKELIKVEVSAGNGETLNLEQFISKIGYELKENPSAYLDMPLQLETGISSRSKTDIEYYGALAGTLDLTPNDRLSLQLRSNTYSTGQVQDNHIIKAEYLGKQWFAAAGNVTELTDFLMDGYGGKVGHNWGVRSKAEVFGIVKSRTGDNKLIGTNISLVKSNNFALTESATANFDNARSLNSYVVKQGVDMKLWNNGKLSLKGGVGMDQSTLSTNTANNTIIGSTVGYNLQWLNKYLSIGSNLLYNSSSFPGFLKGQRQQTHEIRGIYKSLSLGGYYEYTFRKQNYYTDTGLYSDRFNLQTSNYGARAGWSYLGGNVSFSAGRQEQSQIADTLNNIANYLFSYLNLNASVVLFKSLSISVNSYYGYGAIEGQELDSTVYITTNQGSLQYKFVGLTARIDRGPYYYYEYINYLKKPEKYERTILSPFIDIRLFKNSLGIRSQLNYSKTLPENIETSTVLATISYMNISRGFDFNINTIIPVNQASSTPYINLSVRIRLHAPFLPIRKYYDLKLQLVKDMNGNGKMDEGEEPVAGQTISIMTKNALGDVTLVSNEKGNIIYRNVTKGDYITNFGMNSKLKGWLPVAGVVQTFPVTKSSLFFIPYKLSKVVEGSLHVILDSNSGTTFNPANIRVEAVSTDSTGAVFSTLTDDNGSYYLNLPSGNYIIKLGEAAFDENFKPTQFSQMADLVNNDSKTVIFDIKQRKRGINIRKK